MRFQKFFLSTLLTFSFGCSANAPQTSQVKPEYLDENLHDESPSTSPIPLPANYGFKIDEKSISSYSSFKVVPKPLPKNSEDDYFYLQNLSYNSREGVLNLNSIRELRVFVDPKFKQLGNLFLSSISTWESSSGVNLPEVKFVSEKEYPILKISSVGFTDENLGGGVYFLFYKYRRPDAVADQFGFVASMKISGKLLHPQLNAALAKTVEHETGHFMMLQEHSDDERDLMAPGLVYESFDPLKNLLKLNYVSMTGRDGNTLRKLYESKPLFGFNDNDVHEFITFSASESVKPSPAQISVWGDAFEIPENSEILANFQVN